jgi:hypothetical protein
MSEVFRVRDLNVSLDGLALLQKVILQTERRKEEVSYAASYKTKTLLNNFSSPSFLIRRKGCSREVWQRSLATCFNY